MNNMLGRSLGIHWHGMTQKGTNHMDGVPFVTQCPIPSSTVYRYIFNADTVGTHYWHSHSGEQCIKMSLFTGIKLHVPL